MTEWNIGLGNWSSGLFSLETGAWERDSQGQKYKMENEGC